MRLRRPARSLDAHQRLTTLLVCAVATVLFTRALLAATGYPQVGNSSLHIAHVLYGGLGLLAALMIVLALLSPKAAPLAAVLGGVGFGLFIDEVGKFVTRDVNYFYHPAIAIIYITFLVLFALVRLISRRGFDAEEATLIGLEALQRSTVGALSDERRLQVLHLLATTGADGPVAVEVRRMLETASETHAARATVAHRLFAIGRATWAAVSGHRLFRRAVFGALALAALISATEVAWLLRHGLGHLSFSEQGFTLTTLLSDLILLGGALRLSRSLLSALRWYDHAVLLDITVAQVFLYSSEQLVATLNLAALLVVWVALRWAIELESAASLRAAPPPGPQPVAAVV